MDSHYQRPFEVYRPELAVFAHMQLYGFGEAIEAKTILAAFDDAQQLALQFLELTCIDRTLEYGFLDALPHPLARFGDTAKPATPPVGRSVTLRLAAVVIAILTVNASTASTATRT